MMPNRKSKPKLLTDHLKNISVPCSARTDFRELIKSNNRLLNEKHYLEPEKWKRKEQTGNTASAAAIKR